VFIYLFSGLVQAPLAVASGSWPVLNLAIFCFLAPRLCLPPKSEKIKKWPQHNFRFGCFDQHYFHFPFFFYIYFLGLIFLRFSSNFHLNFSTAGQRKNVWHASLVVDGWVDGPSRRARNFHFVGLN